MGRSDSLYKYTRLEFVNSSLNNGIFASKIDSLNDPYESNSICEENCDDYRVVCLSRSRNKKLMWSHYADGHRGCSIKIELPNNYGLNDCLLKRVQYTSKYISKDSLDADEIVNSLYTKDKKWDYELEVRAVYSNASSKADCWKKYRGNIFYKVTISQIDFGCFSHFDAHYLDALIAIRDYNTNHQRKIKVRKYKMSHKKYEFVIDKDFNYIDEIAKLINEEENEI